MSKLDILLVLLDKGLLENYKYPLSMCLCLVLTESGVGAGIDSYYEYVLKAYILLGDDTYLDRFNKVCVLLKG